MQKVATRKITQWRGETNIRKFEGKRAWDRIGIAYICRLSTNSNLAMKAFIALFVLAVLPFCVQAQIPRQISFQGILMGTNGLPKPDSTYSVTFRLYSSATGGVAVWAEPNLSIKITGGKGMMATALGSTVMLPNFDKPMWLSIQLQGETEMTRIP